MTDFVEENEHGLLTQEGVDYIDNLEQRVAFYEKWARRFANVLGLPEDDKQVLFCEVGNIVTAWTDECDENAILRAGIYEVVKLIRNTEGVIVFSAIGGPPSSRTWGELLEAINLVSLVEAYKLIDGAEIKP